MRRAGEYCASSLPFISERKVKKWTGGDPRHRGPSDVLWRDCSSGEVGQSLQRKAALGLLLRWPIQAVGFGQ